MTGDRRLRAGGALGHCLLVVMLALGVATMHTVGHPADSSIPHANGAAHVVAAPAEGGTATGHGTAQSAAEPFAVIAPGAGASGTSPSADEPLADMGLMSVCTAVLSTWLLIALLHTAAARRPGWPVRGPVRVRGPARPGAPPRGPTLARLSVLRI